MNEFSKKDNKQTNNNFNRNIVFYVVSRAIKNNFREFYFWRLSNIYPEQIKGHTVCLPKGLV